MPYDNDTPPESAHTASPAKPADKATERVYLVSHPKIVFLYPSFLAAIAVGIFNSLSGPGETAGAQVATLIFLGILGINVVVLSFDFPRATSLTVFFCLAAIVLGAWVLSLLYPDLLPAVGQWFAKLRPYADPQFYFIFAGILALIYIAVWGTLYFDYWEVRPNELLHHHGLLSDLERFAAPNLRIDKEINDVFEYMLLRSGRLILHPSHERRAIVLENVFFINQKEERITKMLSALHVEVRQGE